MAYSSKEMDTDVIFEKVPDRLLRMDLSVFKYPIHKSVKERIVKSLNLINYYPEIDDIELISLISRLHKVDEKNVMLVNGGDEGINLITRCFSKKGSEVMIFTPTFSQFEIAAMRNECEVKKINSLHGNSFQISLEKFRKSIREKTELIWICNPNNPTGNTVDKGVIERILESFKGIVAVDECCADFLVQSYANQIGKFSNLVIVRSFSKFFGLAGLRIGYLLANENQIRRIRKLRQPATVNMIAQKAAAESLRHIQYYKRIWKEMTKESERMIYELRKLRYNVFSSSIPFMLIRSRNAGKIFEFLKDNDILVLMGDSNEFSGLGREFLRISLGTPEENRKVLSVLKKSIWR